MTVDMYVIAEMNAISGMNGSSVARLQDYLDLMGPRLKQNGAILVPAQLPFNTSIENIVADYLSKLTGAKILEHDELYRVQEADEYATDLLNKAEEVQMEHGLNSVQMNELRSIARTASYSPKARPYVQKAAALVQHAAKKYDNILVIAHRSSVEGLVVEYAALSNSQIPIQMRVGRRRLKPRIEMVSSQYGLPIPIVEDLLTIERNVLYLPHGAAVRFENDGKIKLVGPYQRAYDAGRDININTELRYRLVGKPKKS